MADNERIGGIGVEIEASNAQLEAALAQRAGTPQELQESSRSPTRPSRSRAALRDRAHRGQAAPQRMPRQSNSTYRHSRPRLTASSRPSANSPSRPRPMLARGLFRVPRTSRPSIRRSLLRRGTARGLQRSTMQLAAEVGCGARTSAIRASAPRRATSASTPTTPQSMRSRSVASRRSLSAGRNNT